MSLNSKLLLLRQLFETGISRIDAGNTNISEEECLEIIDVVARLLNPEEKLSKYQVCSQLGIKPVTLDSYIRDGKFPEGRRQQGFKEIFFYQKDVNKYLEEHNIHKSKV